MSGHKIFWRKAKQIRDIARNSGVFGDLETIMDKFIARIFPPSKFETLAHLPTGGTLRIPPGCRVYRDLVAGVYEKEVTALFMKSVKRGMNVVDLGAHIGYYTIIASELVGDSGKVYSFEPDPFNLAYLKRNIEINGCSNVTLVGCAVSNVTGSSYLSIDPYHSQSYVSCTSSERSMDVRTIKLDDFFKNNGMPRIDFMKVDIEGAEVAALQGMKELCERNPGLRIIIECNLKALGRAGVSRRDFAFTLLELGFYKGYIIEQGMKRFDVRVSFPIRSQTAYNLLLERS